MKKNKIYTLLMAVGMLTVMSSCQKQGDDPTPQPESETVDVKFNTFLKEGKNIRPFNIGARSASEGTLANGFYLYGHVHKLPFANTSGNTYTTIFDNVKINADGTYAIPKFWLQDKTLLYSFQAYAATEASEGVAPETPTAAGTPPYASSGPITEKYALYERDILGAAVFDIKMSDEVPTVNLYFEHRLAKLSVKAQRMNPGGPTLYNVKIKLTYEGYYNTTIGWAPTRPVTASKRTSFSFQNYIAVTLPAGDMTPIEVDHYLLPQQVIYGSNLATMTYTLEQGPISGSNPEITLTTALPTFSLDSGKQLNLVIGHVVETEQIVVQSVTLTDWVTTDKNVPEYGGNAPAGCFDIPIGGSFPNTYVTFADDLPSKWEVAKTNCAKWGGRLPSEPELRAMYDNRLKYGTFVSNWYWSSKVETWPFVMNMVTGATTGGNVENPWHVRCVKDKK